MSTGHTVATITFAGHQIDIVGYFDYDKNVYDWYDLFAANTGVCLNEGEPLYDEGRPIEEAALDYLGGLTSPPIYPNQRIAGWP